MSARSKGNKYLLGFKHSPETKKKLSKLFKGKPNFALRGHIHTAEFRAKVSKAQVGKPKFKLRGRKYTPETIARMQAGHFGIKLSLYHVACRELGRAIARKKHTVYVLKYAAVKTALKLHRIGVVKSADDYEN